MKSKLFESIILLAEADKSRFIKPLFADIANNEDFRANVGDEYDELKDSMKVDDNGLCEQTIKWVNSGAADKLKIDWNNKNKIQLFTQIIRGLYGYKKAGGSNKEKREDKKQDPNRVFLDSGFSVAVNKDCSNSSMAILQSLENEKFIFVTPLSHTAAVWMDSFECGGQGAKWCIGYEKDNSYWKDYIHNDSCMFILAFNKEEYVKQENNQTLKYMIQISPDKNETQAWCQEDNPSEVITIEKFKRFFGHDVNELIEAMATHVLCDDQCYTDAAGVWLNSDFEFDKETHGFRDDVLVDRTLYLSDFLAGKYENNSQAIYDAWYDDVYLDCEGRYLYLKDIIGKDTPGYEDAFDMPAFLDWLAEHHIDNINTIEIRNAKFNRFIFEPEASTNKADVHFKNCHFINFYHTDFSNSGMQVWFDVEEPSTIHTLWWPVSEDNFSNYNYHSFNWLRNEVTIQYEEYCEDDE